MLEFNRRGFKRTVVFYAFFCTLAIAITACFAVKKHKKVKKLSKETKQTEGSEVNLKMIGQSDVFGCTPSAGYSWCEKLSKCVQPWKLEIEGGKNSFINYCGKVKSLKLGGKKDEFGCLLAAGYTWCEKQKKCIRPWELDPASDFLDHCQN